uniref:Uncharacterized protein n=1 Tax=Arion vulgaris TaxID=1028688 RepID=A0A0B6YQ93_9EUPU
MEVTLCVKSSSDITQETYCAFVDMDRSVRTVQLMLLKEEMNWSRAYQAVNNTCPQISFQSNVTPDLRLVMSLRTKYQPSQ